MPIPWNITPPKVCKKQEKLFALEKPFYGKRVNKAMLKRKIPKKDFEHTKGLAAMAAAIPTSWSWRNLGNTTYKGKIEKPRDQGQCGSCWAMSTSSSLGDRYSIKYNIPSPYLSPLYLMTGTYNLMQTKPQDSCNNGGDPYLACQWLEKNGNKLEKCWPFSMISSHKWVSPNPPVPKDCCSNCCGPEVKTLSNFTFPAKPNSTTSLVVADNNGNVNKIATIAAIQRDIMTNGPIICGFNVYSDFMDYWDTDAPKGGIYVCSNSSDSNLDGGHAVTVTGWGVGQYNGKTVRYWELRNSWGTYTGDQGYGKVAFSTDVPENAPLLFDIPELQQGDYWFGGMTSILPGTLPVGYKPVTMETFMYGSVPDNDVPSWVITAGWILLVLLLLAVIGWVASKKLGWTPGKYIRAIGKAPKAIESKL